jgi:Cu(I)/Ag(I) efflux system membrane protein CusA/SilA
MIGLLPILWGTGTGASVMKRIAVPMVGGMVSSTLLTLLVVPAIWSLVQERHLARLGLSAAEDSEPSDATPDKARPVIA